MSTTASEPAFVLQARALRAEGLSVREIARRSGLSKTHVSDVLRGRARLSPARADAALIQLVDDRRIKLPDEFGRLRRYDVIDVRDRRLTGRYWRNVLDFLGNRPSNLAQFDGKTVRVRGRQRIALVVDESVLRGMGESGEIEETLREGISG